MLYGLSEQIRYELLGTKMLNGISKDGMAKELQDMRELRSEMRAEARVSREMAGTDGKAQEAEFLEYARTNTATDEFDSLLGLAEGAEAAADGEKPTAEGDKKEGDKKDGDEKKPADKKPAEPKK